MLKASIYNKNAESAGEINLPENIFGLKINEGLVHQAVVAQMSNERQVLAHTKQRADVRGGGKKPWKQKGSGRARVGSIRSPLWRGGGKIFAATGIGRSKRKINKKMYRLGMKIIFSGLFRDNRLKVIDDIVLTDFRTKVLLKEISYLNIVKSSLFIVKNIDFNLSLSTRNLKNISIVALENLNPVILLKFKVVFATVSAIKCIEECFK